MSEATEVATTAVLNAVNAEPQPVYYVIRMDNKGKTPRRKYPGRNMAYRAAESLCHKNPGVEFIVVKLKTTLKVEA